MENEERPQMEDAFKAINNLFESVIEAKNTLGDERLWWRGQPKKYPSLNTKIHRNLNYSDPYREFNKIHEFVRQAPTRYSSWPKERCNQLFLMQHYGLSTRLLDWSSNFLIALYFAVNKEPNEPASLWALNPIKLNRKQFPDSNKAIFLYNSPEVEKIINSAFDGAFSGEKYILAMAGLEFDLRIFAQQSVFTIHASPISLEDLQKELNDTFLYEINIPAEDKNSLRQALEIFGISESRLFPDIQSLASYLECH